MARTITINSVNANGDVNFTMAGLAIGAMNKTYTVTLPVGTKYDLFIAIRQYLTAYALGLQASQAVTQGSAVTAAVGQAQDVDQTLTPGT